MTESHCGSCTLCCKLMAVPTLAKPRNAWCGSCAVGKGCRIYADRPEECALFECYWLQARTQHKDPAGLFPDDLRPDRCHVVVDGTTNKGELLLLVDFVKQANGWSKGLAEWVEGDTVYLSVAFTWRLDDAYMRAAWWRALGYRVVAGGPALFQPKLRHSMQDVAEIPTKQILIDGKLRTVGADHPSGEAIVQHNPMATIASRGCPVGCYFCIVPAMEGREFTLLPDFPVRPILCDNNLSALPAEYQDHIVARYKAAGVPLLDANSGFEPKTFDAMVFQRWAQINRGPWRFAFDEQRERAEVERTLRMLRLFEVPKRRIQVYTLIGNEPFESCMERIAIVRSWGGEPYAQPEMKLNALVRRPWVRFDWTEGLLFAVQRWCNYSSRAGVTWQEYRSSAKTSRRIDGTPLFPD